MNLQTALDHLARVEQVRHKYRTGLVTPLFKDTAESTKLKQALGDREALALMHPHHTLVCETLSHLPDGQKEISPKQSRAPATSDANNKIRCRTGAASGCSDSFRSISGAR